MNSLLFPREVFRGIDTLKKIFSKDYSDVLIISESEDFTSCSVCDKVQKKFESMLTKTKLIKSENPDELFKSAYSYANIEMPECIIAVGSGRVQDCAAAVSRIAEIPYVSVICTAPTQLCEYNTLDVFLYKNLPDVCIIDPVFITCAESLPLAYDALGMMTLALEAGVLAEDRFVCSAARDSFIEIYRNIMPAFRGEISARENLCNAMYAAYAAYINSREYSWQSPAYRTSLFFDDFSGSKLSTLAVCITYLTEQYCEMKPAEFSYLARLAEPDVSKEKSVQTLKKNIRRIQATLAFPSSMKNYPIDEQDFLICGDNISVEEKDFYFKCYYGNVNFVKKESLNQLM